MRTKEQVETILNGILVAYHFNKVNEIGLPVDMLEALDKEELPIDDIPLWAVDELINFFDIKTGGILLRDIHHPDPKLGLQKDINRLLNRMIAFQILASGRTDWLPANEKLRTSVFDTYRMMRTDEVLMTSTAELIGRIVY